MINESELIVRLLLAALFGAVVGLERERKDWVAGLRTHILVCLGAALIMIVSVNGFYLIPDGARGAYDSSRIASQVISGIGFIGAGTIFFLRTKGVKGLTTAAGLWTVAGIGLAVGIGLYLAAATCTGLTIGVLWLLKPVERRLFPKESIVQIIADEAINWRETILPLFEERNINIEHLDFYRQDDEVRIEVTLPSIPDDLLDALRKLPEIRRVSF